MTNNISFCLSPQSLMTLTGANNNKTRTMHDAERLLHRFLFRNKKGNVSQKYISSVLNFLFRSFSAKLLRGFRLQDVKKNFKPLSFFLYYACIFFSHRLRAINRGICYPDLLFFSTSSPALSAVRRS